MDKLAKLSAFHAGDASSNLAGSTMRLCGRTGRVAALSRRSLWDHAPPESPIYGRVAQLAGSKWLLTTRSRVQVPSRPPIYGVLVQKSRTPACHAGGHGFKSRIRRQFLSVALPRNHTPPFFLYVKYDI